MRILHLAMVPPEPPTNGHRLRCRSLLQALVHQGHRVSLLSYAGREEAAAPPPELARLCEEFQLLPEPQENPAWGRLVSLASPRPYGARRFTTAAMRAAVTEKLKQGFDAILCEDIYMAGNVPPDCTLPLLLNKHDITYRIVGQFVRGEHNWLKKLYGRLEHGKIRRLEIAACGAAAVVLACSDWDKELLAQDCPGANFAVLPNVVDVAAYTPANGDDGQTVLFAGAMDWLPNQDGAEYFLDQIMPKLRQLTPRARFVVAGRNPPRKMLRRYGGIPDVHFTGAVRDMRAVIAQAAVCAVSLRIGSGTRMKILEAGALGKAVVSTTLGAEGLGLRHGEEVLLADDPRSFAEAVAALLKDPALRQRLGRAARARVERDFSQAVLQARLAQALAALSGDHTRKERPMAVTR